MVLLARLKAWLQDVLKKILVIKLSCPQQNPHVSLYSNIHPALSFHKLKQSDMKTKSLKARNSDKMLNMPIVNPNAAGIDIGSRSHFVCVAQDNVQEFPVFTEDLHQIAKHLLAHDVKTVAIESTGIYWKPLFILLQDYGFEVFLVNARHIKNVKGHKTDVVDSKWLQMLHSIGLLSDSFQPDVFTHKLRTYTRHRQSLIQTASRYINKMNKVLVLLNIQLKAVLSDITGDSGMKVITAILGGERDAKKLEQLISNRCKAQRKDIEKALQGDWREEYLYELQDCYDLYHFFWDKIRKTDQEIDRLLTEQAPATDVQSEQNPPTKKKKNRRTKNAPNVDVVGYALQQTGVDLTEIPGVNATTILTLISETGLDLSKKFKTAKSFASWLGFTPNKKITGGKEISSRTQKQTNPLAYAIRQASNGAGNSKTQLGDFFRKIAYKKGRMVAIIATARKISVIIYKMLTDKVAYNYQHSEPDPERTKKIKLKQVVNTIKSHNISMNELNLAVAK
jgi:transposase